MISASTQLVSVVPGQTDRTSGSAQPRPGSAASRRRIRRTPGRSITPSGKGGTGPRSDRRTIVCAAPGSRRRRALTTHDERMAREIPRSPVEFDRDRMGQVAGQWRRHREARRITKDPFAAERQVTGRLVAHARTRPGLQPDCARDRLVPDRVGEVQDGAEPEDRVELEIERDVRELDLPGAGQSARPDPALKDETMGAVGREVVGDDREVDSALPGLPRGELLHRGAAGAQDAVRPLQVIRTDVARVIDEERDLDRHGDRDLDVERARITPTGPPGHGVTATEDRLLLLGNELVVPPEARQRPPGGHPPRLGFGRAEDPEQLPGTGPAELGDGLDLLRGDVRLAEPGHRLVSPQGPAEPAPAADDHDGGQDHPDRRLGLGEPVPPRPGPGGSATSVRPSRGFAGPDRFGRISRLRRVRVRLAPLPHHDLKD